MKTTLMALTLLTAVAIPSAKAVAGGNEGGGGGGAYVCRDSSTHAIISVELLDLFETRSAGNEITFDDVNSVDVQVEGAIAKLKKIFPQFAADTEANWRYIENHKSFGPSDLEIDVDDAFSNFKKAGCELEGMMYYSDRRQRLIVKGAIFNAQKRPTEYAASYVHEAVYKTMRDDYDETDSDHARQISGCLFAKNTEGCLNLKPIQIPINKGAWKCSDNLNTYYVYGTGVLLNPPNSDPMYQYRIVFTKLGGSALSYETSTYAGDRRWPTVAGGVAHVDSFGIEFQPQYLAISGLEFLSLQNRFQDSAVLYKDANFDLIHLNVWKDHCKPVR
jgi:hypothetical protein